MSGEWRVKSGQPRVLGTGKRPVTRLHYLKDCAETKKRLNARIK